MKDLKIILENVDDICEKFELEGLHTHPTYKQFKRLFTALNRIAEPVQLVSYATDMSTCTLTNGDGTGYFYDRVDPDQPTSGYTAVDMANAARDGFRDGAASVEPIKAFANEITSAAFEGGSFDGGDIQDMAIKHGLMRIESRAEECCEGCQCREYGFPTECYRKTELLTGGSVKDE